MKKLNVINRESDRMLGRRPIEFIEAANPTVIIDEPQSVDTTEKSRRAIGNLNPVAVHVQNYRRLNQRRFWMHFGSGDQRQFAAPIARDPQRRSHADPASGT